MGPTTKMEDRLSAGHRLSHPPPGDEVLITGVAGYFPDSDSVLELQENLFNKVDLISSDARRWKIAHHEIPQRTGKINHISKFDASFFGVHFTQAHTMDPMGRVLMEKAFEAIIDAGVNPNELKDKRVGVFIGTCFSESEKKWMYDKMQINGFGILGCSRAMMANRLSQLLGVTGPSYTTDTACSSSLTAMEHAFRAIRDGRCDSAIVGGANLCLCPYVSLMFHRLGVLSPDGCCKTFDKSANGYARAEAVAVCYLQKAKDSRRAYAQFVYAKTNCDGYKEFGISYPSGQMQRVLMQEVYEECGVPPESVEFVEAHGTGTQAGDPEELRAIDEVFCKEREKPLLVGSSKSNFGHTEPVSGICSIVKMCIAYATGYIPPNIYFSTPREDMEVIISGRAQVVLEKQPWGRGMSAVNSFGFGGANVHVLLKNFARTKVNCGLPADCLPRLVCASGGTESAVAKIFDDLESRPLDAELVRLWHAIHDYDIRGHDVRGYTLLRSNKESSTPSKAQSIARSTARFSGVRRPVWFVYSGAGSQWPGMAAQLMRLPVFAAAIQKCHKALEPLGVNVTKIVTELDSPTADIIEHSSVGIVAVQVGLTDVLKAVGIEPDHIIGHGVGELGCAYADGCLSAEQTVLAAYWRGQACVKTPSGKGSMATVGLGYNQIQSMCPHEVEVCCHDGAACSTVAGPAAAVRALVGELAASGIFAQELSCSNIAYHSKYIAGASPIFLKYLKDVIPEPKLRSERWVSTSVPQQFWNDATSKLCSAEYHVNNLVRPVLFWEAARLVPPHAVTVELAPHALLQHVLRSLHNHVLHVPLMLKGHEDNIEVLLTGLGKLFEAGLNPHLAEIYPHVQFPVSNGTPMMAHLVEWEHSEDWDVEKYHAQEILKSKERLVTMYLDDERFEYMDGHVVDGRNLYPATGYLVMVWETLGMMMGIMYTELSVVFENVRFQRATNVPKAGILKFIITIQFTGNFEIVESGTTIVTGRIYAQHDVAQSYRALPAAGAGAARKGHVLHTKDFYKELRLRGYQYSGKFRGVALCNLEGTRARLAWYENFTTFMDTMMQLKIIGYDTRALLVPTRIDRLSIDAGVHYQAVTKLNSKHRQQPLDAYVYPDAGIIRSGGIEICGLHASSITRRAPRGEPVLEKSLFVPYFGSCKMRIEDILRVVIHILIENLKMFKMKSIELVDEEYKKNGYEPLIEQVGDILGDLPLMQAELLVISEETIEMPKHIAVENKKISSETNAALFIGGNMLSRPDVLKQALSTLKEKSFIMSREKERPDPKAYADKYDIVTIHETGSEYVVLFRNKIVSKPAKFINIATADDTFSWIEPVKEELKKGQKVVLYAQNESNMHGLLGLVNCLKRETGGEIVNGLLIADQSAPPFNSDLELYAQQLEKDLAQNVLQDGHWGAYRYCLLGDLDTVQTDHAYVNTLTIGDLSSMRWLEGQLKHDSVFEDNNYVLIHVYCAALNFRDVMAATGRLPVDTLTQNRLGQECVQGLEVVGRTKNGSRVMALVEKGMATLAQAQKSMLWGIPDDWTFEEAVTVPVVYFTVYNAFVMVGHVRAGETILIHAGSGGVGQAAINVALHFGCEVFTTVGSAEKRAFIKKLFPALKDSHIGNSRDTSFENMIRMETNGKGVDVVLNCLSDEILLASVRCLGYRGRFLEIGKFDISNNTPISMLLTSKEISFHGIMVRDYTDWSSTLKQTMHDLILTGIESGAVRPLTRCSFEKHEVESAFRYMAAGKHVGKLILKIREEEHSHEIVKPTRILIDVIPRYICSDDAVYVVVGGLGGFGLELADWLVLRGARRLLLSSRHGLVNGYQAARMRAWESYGATVHISTHDVTSEAGCEDMLRAALAMGPVLAVFNLAVVLKDAIFQNQTPETFRTSFAPKALATMHLDKLTRKLCPDLKNFVVFSSLACGRGNPGQTNYGFSNAVMERICERRKQSGLPALAVQWGAVGDVGLVADMFEKSSRQLDIGGTLPQGISSCLLTLDKFLRQDATIVSSMVVAEKKVRGAGCATPVEAVAQIMGIRDLKTVSYQATLAEMGMDSMMGVEIKQTLEREFEIFLTAQDIRTLTFARLVELSVEGAEKSSSTDCPSTDDAFGLGAFVRNFGDEELVSIPFVYMPTILSNGTEGHTDGESPPIFMLPGMDGFASTLEPLCRGLQRKACVLQLGVEHPGEDIDAMADRLFQTMRTILAPGDPFTLLGYSFGCHLMLELAARLEKAGHEPGLVLSVDGAPEYGRHALSSVRGFKDTAQLQNILICRTIDVLAPNNDITSALMSKVCDLETYEEKVKCAIKMSSIQDTKYTPEFVYKLAGVMNDRVKIILNFNSKDIKKINAPIVLLRSKESQPNVAYEKNYGLDKFTHSTVTVHCLDSTHVTILENKECANIINEILLEKEKPKKVSLERREQSRGSLVRLN